MNVDFNLGMFFALKVKGIINHYYNDYLPKLMERDEKEYQMKFKFLITSLMALPCLLTANASIILEGDFVKTAISDNGTLGYGGRTTPGLLHDASGTGTFGTDDYLTPGSPWEYFGVESSQTGAVGNNNSQAASNAFSMNSLTDISGTSAYDNAVNWSGTYGSYFSLSTDTYFNDGNEFVSFMTTITALTDLSSVSFLRAIDPDMPSSSSTNNNRGFGALSPSDWVNSENISNGLTLGLYSISDVTHNTGVTSWATAHSGYLSGTNVGNGDNTIGMAFDIGSLAQGETASFKYHYVMGDTPATVDIPTDVPEPSTLAIFALGIMGLASRRFKKQS
jgi:hypothetical protein